MTVDRAATDNDDEALERGHHRDNEKRNTEFAHHRIDGQTLKHECRHVNAGLASEHPSHSLLGRSIRSDDPLQRIVADPVGLITRFIRLGVTPLRRFR